jgi:hypothetical protein
MPFVRVGRNKDAAAERVRIGSQAGCGAMIETANVPINDMFQVEDLGTLVSPVADEV